MDELIRDADIPTADPADIVEQYKRWVCKIANQYQSFLGKNGRMDMEDLKQAGYIGLLQAQKTYIPDNGAFTGWSAFYIRKYIRYTIGFRQDGSLPPGWMEISLDAPLPEADGLTLKDIIADTEVLPPEEAIVEAQQQLEVSEHVRKAVERLKNGKQREVITKVYLEEQTTEEAADSMGLTAKQIRSISLEGRYKLQRDRKLKTLAKKYFGLHVGKKAFNSTFTSAVELAVLRREQEFDRAFGMGAYAVEKTAVIQENRDEE
ncbi:MAG: sigma-70 family RNA polymerase sigma factor [Clostridia bacterium]|nr:sigma-70 family RNA polymerase sigma factor [Clostridia bacterium]